MKRELAIALGYRVDEESAPRVLATGEGWLARKIQEIAKAHGIPREADADLATILAQCPLHSEIPSELYPAVAEIFAFLHLLGRRTAREE
jgi:flagellar biosynthesis protein